MTATEKTDRRQVSHSYTPPLHTSQQTSHAAFNAITSSQSSLSNPSRLSPARVSAESLSGLDKPDELTSFDKMKNFLLKRHQRLAEPGETTETLQKIEQEFISNIKYLDDVGCSSSIDEKIELFRLVLKGFELLRDAVIAQNPSINQEQVLSITQKRIAVIDSRLKALQNVDTPRLSTTSAQEALAAWQNADPSTQSTSVDASSKTSPLLKRRQTDKEDDNYSFMKKTVADINQSLFRFIDTTDKSFHNTEILTHAKEGFDQQLILLNNPLFKCSDAQNQELLELILVGFMLLQKVIDEHSLIDTKSISNQISAVGHQIDIGLNPFPTETFPTPKPSIPIPIQNRTHLVYCYTMAILVAGLAIVAYPYFSMTQK